MGGDGLRLLGMNLGWAAVVVWFSANLLSQAVYIGFNGVPYDANAMLSGIGGWYWAFVAIELTIWVLLGTLVVQKVRVRIAEVAVPEAV